MSASAATALDRSVPHLHVAGEICPWCEQPIPHDKFAEISARIAEREGARFAEMSAALKEQHAREKAQLEASAKAALDQAREEARQETEEKAQAKLEEAARERAAAEAELRARIAQSEESGADLRDRLEQLQLEHAAALQQIQRDAAEREAIVRQEARAAAEAAMQDRIAAAEQAKAAAETELQARIAASDQQIQDLQESCERLAQGAAEREAAIREEAEAAAQAAMQEKLAAAEQGKAAAEEELRAKALAEQERLQKLEETHEADLNRRLQEQREALEQEKTAAVNAEKSNAFEENLKLSETVQQLQRKLDNKTTEELGEGAEIDLFEALKGEFEGDRIIRINKGQPGADILHVVIHNGKECGSIIYDSKNRNAWRNDYVTKLAQDQMAAKAEHAILSTHKFPAGVRHLHVQDGVILASPARVIALVQIVRQHVVQGHTMRMSNAERAEKTAALYDFITSERCSQLFARIDSQAQEMLDLQEKEMRAHKATWNRQGELYRSVQKVRAELCFEIDRIIGTAEVEASTP